MSYAEALAAQYNARLTRNDIEWFVDHGGNLRLRDRPSWSAAKTREMAEQAERDRQQFKHRMEYPINREAAE